MQKFDKNEVQRLAKEMCAKADLGDTFESAKEAAKKAAFEVIQQRAGLINKSSSAEVSFNMENPMIPYMLDQIVSVQNQKKILLEKSLKKISKLQKKLKKTQKECKKSQNEQLQASEETKEEEKEVNVLIDDKIVSEEEFRAFLELQTKAQF